MVETVSTPDLCLKCNPKLDYYKEQGYVHNMMLWNERDIRC